ncbi:MAG TPA: glycoside hydrolase family 2 TIM barrel-domain containing protein [Solirubrobacteraceae bacterium]|jgi:beta-galactosidase/beta-glucuronidase|nr:glycoside hydrolase family 2 TIM barrel-domain containing protein [Solirubrobacteraceae bacterium]
MSSAAKLTSAMLLACAAFCAALAAGAAAPSFAPPLQAVVFEGPGGRMPLTQWTLRKDPSDRGAALGWQRGGFAGATVSLPNVVSAAPYTGHAGARNYEGSVAWYRTSLQVAQAGTYALDFQSANYLASVWVDGRELGSHRGSYLPFELRARLAAGTHTVVVRTDWRDPAQQAREGFHRTWFNWGGLDGEVSARRIGESEISEPTLETTLTPDTPQTTSATVTVSVEVHNYGPSRTIAPEGSLVHGAQTIKLSFAPVALAHGGAARATATAQVPAPALWSPAAPNMYALSLAVGNESSYTANVGLRQLTWHGGHVYLNGTQLQLQGASIMEDARGHGDALSPADEAGIVSELQQIHANVARSQHPLDPALLERLDAAGILVWQGIGPVEGAANWYSTTPRLLADAEQQAKTAAIAAELHPSIFAWNLVDEVADNGRDSQEVSYVRTLTRWLHAHDPTRMVAVDVWGDHPPAQAGALYSEVDAVAETDYSGWYDYPHDSPAQLAAKMRARLAAMERTFAGKVLVISEFGAESNGLNPRGAAGSYAYQAKLLAEHIAVYEADPHLTAMMIWVLRDYPLTPTFMGGSVKHVLPSLKLIEGLNQKGLFTYGGQAKPGVVSTVARLFGALPRE